MRASRRAVLGASLGALGATVVPVRPAGATGGLTMWMLDPDWGHELGEGSARRTRCRGRACHSAAPHRFFLTRSEAESGRLHPCCLAQPVEVQVPTTLDRIEPWYRARLGGIDARCPELPDDVRTALAVPVVVQQPGPGSPVGPAPRPAAPGSGPAPAGPVDRGGGRPRSDPGPGAARAGASPRAVGRPPERLAMTGTGVVGLVGAALGSILAGGLAQRRRGADGDDTSPDAERDPDRPDA
jgi:hypothetical protein